MMLSATINTLIKKAAHLRNNLPSGNTSMHPKEEWRYSTSDTPREENYLPLELAAVDFTVGQGNPTLI